MLVRVRTNTGVWRIDHLNERTANVSDIINKISETRPNVVYESGFCFDPGYKRKLNESLPLSSQGITHGSMVYCRVDSSSCIEINKTLSNDNKQKNKPNASESMTRRVVKPDGSIELKYVDPCLMASGKERGFRPGMLPLRDIKKAWTMNDFIAMDEKYTFKIKRQDVSWTSVSLDSSSCQDFYRYLSLFEFKRHRFGYLYGTVQKDEENEDKWKVHVECIYEPPQEANPDVAEGFDILDDPREDRVEKLSSMLGLQQVGWIFGHQPRDKLDLSSAEIIMAAELQLKAADGVEPTPFVTVKVTIGEDGNVSFEAYQVSLQCMQMVAEQALEVNPDSQSSCAINPSFTAIQEGKKSLTVENSFFLCVIPIQQHVSDKFVSQFPKSNREQDIVAQTQNEMKKQLSKSGSQGWTFVDLLSDFHLLLYLCDSLDINTDMAKICESVVNRDVSLDDGYKLIITSMAGMDTHY